MYKVSFYAFLGKTSPVKKFLDSCQPSLRTKIIRQLKYLEEYGLNPAIPNIKKITNTSLWELRVLGRDNIRIICVSQPERDVKVLHIFRKKKQKTPTNELNVALKRNREVFDFWYPIRYHTFAMKDITLNDYLKEQLKDLEFKKEWEKSEAAYQITRELIRARIEGKLSQRQLAQKTGTTQAVISRIENMSVSPSIGLVQRIANSLGKKLEIKFT